MHESRMVNESVYEVQIILEADLAMIMKVISDGAEICTELTADPYSSDYEEYSLQGCNATYYSRSTPTFLRNRFLGALLHTMAMLPLPHLFLSGLSHTWFFSTCGLLCFPPAYW
jgi:hypothetical protein